MTGKTKKELQAENSALKEELSEVNNKLSKISEKYENLQKSTKPEKIGQSLECLQCAKKFKSVKDLKKHKEKHKLQNEMYPCSECEKEFDEEWKMRAHKKNHTKFKCDICEKTFKCQEVMEKHVKIAHEKMKIYCHFFNNKKICPYDKECIFLHEDSDVCRYDMLCERKYCMYKHGNVIVEETKKDDEPSDSVILEETENLNNETINKTFDNPSQNDQSNETFQCDFCIFSAVTNINLKKHQEANCCSICHTSQGCEANLRDHIKYDHKE